MPNWCYNLWQIEGETDDIIDFKLDIIDVKDSSTCSIAFERILDEEDLEGLRVSAQHLTTTDHGITIDFESAWIPPCVEMNLIRGYPNLKFTITYYECGIEIIGMTIGEEGKVTYAKHYNHFDYTDNEFVDFIRKTGMECEEYIQERIDDEMKDQDNSIYS